VCVICPPDGEIGQEAISAGATIVGTETVFEDIRNGRIKFDRLIAHEDYLASLMKSGIARILGPLHLMPSAKSQTVTKDVASAVQRMRGSTKYAEDKGVVRMPIGKMELTPEQLSDNIKILMETVKKDMEKFGKEVLEVVLSSTHGPGFSLVGRLMSDKGCDPSMLRSIN
jgi:large subunit ribosomal protein L1